MISISVTFIVQNIFWQRNRCARRLRLDRALHCAGGSLVFLRRQRLFFASNSLVCLLAYLGAELDSTHNYKEQSDSILVGINGYKSTFPILHETIKSFEQILYFPIKLTKHGFESQRFDTQNNFNDYSEYYSSLRKILKTFGSTPKVHKEKAIACLHNGITRL